jgi:hypothetical protein
MCLPLEVLRIVYRAAEGKCAWLHVQLFLPLLLVSSRNQCHNSQWTSACNNQQCKITQRKTSIWSCIAWCSHINSWMLTWIHAMKHVVHWWTLFLNTASCSEVLFTHMFTIYLSTHDRIVFWVKESVNFTVELEHSPPHVQWTGTTATYLIGSYFFKWPIDTVSYAGMLETWLIPQRGDRGLMQDVWLQHGGESAHLAIAVCIVLSEHCLGCWIGRGIPTSPTPLSWPIHTPDLTTLGNFWWGIINRQVAAHHCHNNDDLHRAVDRCSPLLHHKCFSARHTEHSSASGCVSDMMVYMHVHVAYHDCRHGLC